MYDLVIPQVIQMLENLQGLVQAAAAHAKEHKFDPEVLLNTRLTPDQFDFKRQVQVACDNGKGIAARLSGQGAPAHEDTETTVEQLCTRIDATLEFIRSVEPSAFDDWESQRIEFHWYPGKFLTGRDYLVHFGLPNFYFHVTTAYSILRANGVPVGKQAFLGAIPFQDLPNEA